jgi:WD40 repeat protein
MTVQRFVGALLLLLCVARIGLAQTSAPAQKELKFVRLLAPAGTDQAPGAQCTVGFAPDGLRIVAGWQTDVARIISIPSGEVLGKLAPQAVQSGWDSRTVSGVTFSPDGRSVLTGSIYTGPAADVFLRPCDHIAHLWDVESGQEVRRFQGHTDTVHSAAFNADGTRVVTASADGTVRIWDAATGRELRVLKGHAGPVYVARFSPDGKQAASGGSADAGADGLLLHDVDNAVAVWREAAGRGVGDLAYSPDGRFLAVGGVLDPMPVWDCSTKKLAAGLDALGSPKNVRFTSDGKELVITGQRRDKGPDGSVARVGLIRIYDCSTWTLKAEAPAGFVLDLAVSPDGHYIVTGTGQGLELWSYGPPQ